MHADENDVRLMSDERFLRDCRWEVFRGSGPGGQKRNKTSSAVRIVHIPTGEEAVASERRSQAQNRANALRRLRHRVVLAARREVKMAGFSLPAWWNEYGGLGVLRRHTEYLAVLGLTLDVLAAADWRVSDAAKLLGASTAALSGFLADDRKAWATVNAARVARGLRPLTG